MHVACKFPSTTAHVRRNSHLRNAVALCHVHSHASYYQSGRPDVVAPRTLAWTRTSFAVTDRNRLSRKTAFLMQPYLSKEWSKIFLLLFICCFCLLPIFLALIWVYSKWTSIDLLSCSFVCPRNIERFGCLQMDRSLPTPRDETLRYSTNIVDFRKSK